MPSLAHLPDDIAKRRVISTRDAAIFCNLSINTLRRLNDGKSIPAPIRLSERRLGWRIGDLMDWLDCREKGLDWHVYRAALARNDNRHQTIRPQVRSSNSLRASEKTSPSL